MHKLFLFLSQFVLLLSLIVVPAKLVEASSNLLEKTIFKFRPDVIVNFAAESHVDRSIDNPDLFLINNFI